VGTSKRQQKGTEDTMMSECVHRSTTSGTGCTVTYHVERRYTRSGVESSAAPSWSPKYRVRLIWYCSCPTRQKTFCVHIDKVKPFKAESMPWSWLLENDEQCEAPQGNETKLQSLEAIPMTGVSGGCATAGTVPCTDSSTAWPRRLVGRPQRYLD